MTAVASVCLGYLLAFVDVRVGGLDLAPDALGWVFVVLGLSRLAGLDGRFRRVRLAAVCTGLLSLADLLHPVVTTTTGSPGTGLSSTTSVADPGGVQGLVLLGYVLAETVTSVLLSLAVRDAARDHEDHATERRFARFARLHVLFGLIGAAATVIGYRTGPREVTGPGAVTLVLVVLVVLAFAAWFVVALYGCRSRRYLTSSAPVSEPVPSPEPPY